MPVEMPVRQAPVPAGDGAWQPGQPQLPRPPAWSEETLTIPAVAASGDAAAPQLGGEGPDVRGDGWSRDEASNPGRTGDGAQAGVGRPRRVLPSPEALRR